VKVVISGRYSALLAKAHQRLRLLCCSCDCCCWLLCSLCSQSQSMCAQAGLSSVKSASACKQQQLHDCLLADRATLASEETAIKCIQVGHSWSSEWALPLNGSARFPVVPFRNPRMRVLHSFRSHLLQLNDATLRMRAQALCGCCTVVPLRNHIHHHAGDARLQCTHNF
jgi:hypothetical protein